MIELNAPVLKAPDILALLPTLEASVESSNASAPPAQNFSAMLTELVGTGEQPELPAATPEMSTPEAKNPELEIPEVTRPEVKLPEPAFPEIKLPEVNVPEPTAEVEVLNPEAAEVKLPAAKVPEVQPQAPLKLPEEVSVPEAITNTLKLKEPQKAQETPASFVVPALLVHFVPAFGSSAAAVGEQPAVRIEEPAAETPVELAANPMIMMMKPELEKAWAETKTFELTVQREAAAPLSHPAGPAAPAEAPKQAMVTTDPLVNIKQQQLPPRILAIQKVTIETRLPERSKADHGTPPTEPVSAPAIHFTDVSRPVEQIEQARPAHDVNIPVVPQPQMVRTVAMEVGEADSQVMIRIQERGGDITLQLNTVTEPLHQNLQSSVGSLVQALRKEQVQVSSVEVSRKPSIEKVRRSKEAN